MTHRDLEACLRQLVLLGALAVLLIPAARGSSALLGWLPLWLLGMPLAAWGGLRLAAPRPQASTSRRWRPLTQRRRAARAPASRLQALRRA